MALFQAIIILGITSVLWGETVDGYMNGLQVTPDSNNKSPQFSLTNRSGRVLLKKKWLGLLNASINGQSSTQVLAVEFDTIKSPGTNDPDANHVGINVNDINSINFTSLYHQIYYDIQAWIQYNGSTKILSVYVAKYPAAQPPQPLVYSIDLSNNTLGTELHRVKAKGPLVIALSVCLAFLLFVALGIIVVVVLKRRKSKANSAINVGDALENIPGRPREFRYRDLKKATNNFSPEVLLGRGGFGSVYKGTLPKEKTVVAVKRMTNGTKNGKDVFISEISVITRLSHKNLVPLLGWCHEKGELMIVYEWMPNCSLDKHIFNRDAAGIFLDLEQRYKIVSDVASALLYLHEECEQKVIHRDVKPGNIMLDTEYNARLGDFGLARLIEHDRTSFHVTKEVAGTPGYMAPEYIFSKRATAESDVFSFGAVILAVTCGKLLGNSEVVDLIGWVWKLYDENRLLEAADSRLATLGSINGNEEDMRRLLMLGLACSSQNPEERPTMREVTQILARIMPPPSLPMPPPSVHRSRPDVGSSQLGRDISSTATLPTSTGSEVWYSIDERSEIHECL